MKKNKIGKVILIIFMSLIIAGIAYVGSYYIDKLYKYADMFGLSEKTGIEIEEATPEVSNDYSVMSAIGQGTNNYTTVGLARYVATIANQGTCYNLSLVDKVTDSNENLLQDFTPEIRNTVELSPSTWKSLHEGMRQVVMRKSDYSLLSSYGINVAGKTGTAEETRKRANHALFVSYAPYENPEITVTTRIANGYTSNYAANLTRDIYLYYFNIKDEDAILSGTASRPDVSSAGGD